MNSFRPSSSQAPPLGMIETVHGPVIDIRCSQLPQRHRALYVELDQERYIFEVYRHLDEERVRAIALHQTAGLKRQMPVFDTGGTLQVPVTPECLGRLLNLFGEPLDGGPPLAARAFRPLVVPPAALSEAAGLGLLITPSTRKKSPRKSKSFCFPPKC